MKKIIGYINLYSNSKLGIKYLHWQGLLSKTRHLALKNKDRKEKGVKHEIGEVSINIKGE